MPQETAPAEPPAKSLTAVYGLATARAVRSFFAAHQEGPTPLVALPKLAAQLGLGAVLVKDESKRLGTSAFKVSGAAYAMADYVANQLGISLVELKDGLTELGALWKARRPEEQITFVTCTDGNHGQAVAWAAKCLGQRAVVYMPCGSTDSRVERVRAQGGECTVTEVNYDATVELAGKQAREHGWILLQDTTMPGYTAIPGKIMQGYTAMVDEACEQADAPPTHVVLQVGVGSMASAVLSYLVERAAALGSPRPIALTLEPQAAACVYESALDGSVKTVDGDLDTMIAGLACGVPSTLAWPILAEHVDGGFAWICDALAGNGMRALAREGVVAGECGGAAVGLLQRLMADGCLQAAALRRDLKLGPDSRILIINTEGATDPVNYDRQMNLPDVPPASCDFGFAPPLQPRDSAKRRKVE